jgi:hypothetical protein
MTVLGHVVRRNSEVAVGYPVGLPGPLPLIVVGHEFAVTPATYSRLLYAWAHAGYVAAAPTIPLKNAGAPAGPNENDLVSHTEPGPELATVERMTLAFLNRYLKDP